MADGADILNKKTREYARIIRQDRLSENIYSMWLSTKAALNAAPGQFVTLYVPDQRHILPRPISIAEIRRDASALRLVYRVAGEGTRELSELHAKNKVLLLGPLGNGYPLQGGRTMVVGGGIGIPPLLELVKELNGCGNGVISRPALSVTAVLGYRTDDLFLYNDFSMHSDVYIATDDGKAGCHGTVLDCINENRLTADVIYACGPLPMLRGVKQFASRQQIRCFLSLEERMACGVGACLGCVTRTVGIDDHSKVRNARVCTEGPVFPAEEVDI